MQRKEVFALLVILGVVLVGPKQCQGAPVMFQRTQDFFKDFMNMLTTATASLGTAAFPKTSQGSTSLFKTAADKTSVASPTQKFTTITEPDEQPTDTNEVNVGLRSGISFDTEEDENNPNLIPPASEKPRTPETQTEELYRNGPIYEYETVTIRVPASRSRLLVNALDNDLDTSESSLDSRFIIKRIKVPIRRMRGDRS